MLRLLLLLLLVPFCSYSQISGIVLDSKTSEPIYQAKIKSNSGLIAVTDEKGAFVLQELNLPDTILVRAFGYIDDTIFIEPSDSKNPLIIELVQEGLTLEKVVVTSGRRAEKIEDVPVSMEVLTPELIDNKGMVNLEQAVDQSPGVYAMDGQVSIRGGGGFAYGAGSRVLVLVDGIPMISPDLGDAKWNAIPMENIEQVEILKGASSVLYGSGALNGIIALTNKEPSPDGELKVKVQSGIYDNPKRESLRWWKINPTSHLLLATYGKSFGSMGYNVAVNGYTTDGYKEGETEDRARLSGMYYYRPKNIKNLKLGAAYAIQLQRTGNFILWESDSLAYTPFGGADPNVNPESSLDIQQNININVDPYLKYYDKHDNKHDLKLRYYLVSIGNPNSIFSNSKASMYYTDYQFSRKMAERHDLTAGITNSSNTVRSSVFGDHLSWNLASYGQTTFHWNKLDLIAGVRLEYYRQDDRAPDSEWYIHTKGGDSTAVPIYPVVRTAVHYEITKTTHVRSSFGQGIRFPAVAERFAATSTGGLIVFPNPTLLPEKGWAGEVGIKQIFRIGDFKASVDVAGFINQYKNMIEFTFGYYKPDSIPASSHPDSLGYFLNWLGFSATNAENARISGIEFSFNTQGKIGQVELTSLIGYTYMNPISLNTNTAYLGTFSDTSTNMLKYRFKHMAKADVQADYKAFSAGVSTRYNSYMSNIDRLFEDGIQGTQVLPGLKEYRLQHQEGSLVFDARIAYEFKDKYKVSFIVNNLRNTEYSSRPADIQAPRQFLAQLQFKM